MKKIILSAVLLVSLPILYGQTSTSSGSAEVTKPTTAQTQTEENINTDIPTVARNIDRMLVYFNRYRQAGDFESISKLVSEENKNFYTNFIKYIKTSPVFTLKRDASKKITKTPTGQYIIQTIMVADKKETRVPMTFVEEKTDKGVKWLIYNTNLHNQNATSKPNTPTNTLGSSALPNKPKDTSLPSKTTTELPVVQETNSKTSSNTITPIVLIGLLIVVSIATSIFWLIMLVDCIRRDFENKTLWLLLLIFFGLPSSIAYYFIVKRISKQKNTGAASVATVGALSTAATNIVSEPTLAQQASTPVPPSSNVTVSKVEDIHPLTASSELGTQEHNSTTTTQENIEAPISVTRDSSDENVIKSTSTASTEESLIVTQESENESLSVSKDLPNVSEDTKPEEEILAIASQPEETPSVDIQITAQGEELPVADIFKTPDTKTEVVNEEPETTTHTETSPQDLQPHALFDGLLNEGASTESAGQKIITAQ